MENFEIHSTLLKLGKLNVKTTLICSEATLARNLFHRIIDDS